MAHALSELLDGAVHGRFPEPDGRVEVVGAPPEGLGVLMCFTAHSVVALNVDPTQAERHLTPGDLAASTSPAFLQFLEAQTGCRAGIMDVVLASFATGGGPPPDVERVDGFAHPRVDRASRHRADVRVYTTTERDGVVVLGRGVTRRWEVAFEVDERSRGRGMGRSLLDAARALLPAGTPLWMQVAPGNARSLRAAMAAGFLPIGSEVLFVPSS